MRKQALILSVFCASMAASSAARADLATAFSGFTAVNGAGTSGQQSSYYTAVNAGNTVSGISALPTLGPGLVSYPNVGALPSPGHHNADAGRFFDIGMIGVRFVGNQVTVQLASAVNSQTGVNYGGANYNIGDVFLTVDDGAAGVKQFALLSQWARSGSTVLSLNGGQFGAAQAYHTAGREGHLIGLSANSQVQTTGGTASYTAGHGVVGLDRRVFVSGGNDLGATAHSFGSTSSTGMSGLQSFYMQSWTFDRSLLSLDSTFSIALHAAVSCGNDTIAGIFNAPTQVPAPGAALLAMLGLGAVNAVRRRIG